MLITQQNEKLEAKYQHTMVFYNNNMFIENIDKIVKMVSKIQETFENIKTDSRYENNSDLKEISLEKFDEALLDFKNSITQGKILIYV